MAAILFRPVCSKCDNQLHLLIDCEEEAINDAPPFVYRKNYHITPEYCPYCEEYFTGIEMPGSVPFDNRLSVSLLRKDD